MNELAPLLAELESLEVADFDFKSSHLSDKQFPSSGMEKLKRICEQILESGNQDSCAEALFKTIEKLADNVDLGSPGVLVHTLEKVRSNYEMYLLQSLQRKPTELTLWMVCRLMDGPDCTDRDKWIDVIRSVEHSSNASGGTKQFVEDFLLDEGLIE